MIIDRQSHEVNRLETIDGKLVDCGKVTSQVVSIYAHYTCEDEDFLDFLIEDMENTLAQLYEKRKENKTFTKRP